MHLSATSIKAALDNKFDTTVLYSNISEDNSYGRVIIENGEVVDIVEAKDATAEQLKVSSVNSGTYCFDNKLLFSTLKNIGNDNSQNEYYLTDVPKTVDSKVSCIEIEKDEMIGINDKKTLMEANEIMINKVVNKHIENGVTFTDVRNVYIEDSVNIEANVTIEGNVTIKGNTLIKNGSTIFANSYIEDATIDSANIGPFARLRKGANILSGARVGNFVEIKNSTIGENTSVGHHAYVGDAIIGSDCNVGAGPIFANYDGEKKNKITIGNKTFIGSNVTLVAPLTIGDSSLIAAGSTITDNIDNNSKAFGRARQINK
jgi:bifunctional UDP-N-acetylglucosamine pyrophosphorylase/glucosamine-1-phosphate N-acetyltransferase